MIDVQGGTFGVVCFFQVKCLILYSLTRNLFLGKGTAVSLGRVGGRNLTANVQIVEIAIEKRKHKTL